MNLLARLLLVFLISLRETDQGRLREEIDWRASFSFRERKCLNGLRAYVFREIRRRFVAFFVFLSYESRFPFRAVVFVLYLRL